MAKIPLNGLSQEIHGIVARYSGLADAILKTQCRMLGVEPDQVTTAHLPLLAERIGHAVGMFTSPLKGLDAERAIRSLR